MVDGLSEPLLLRRARTGRLASGPRKDAAAAAVNAAEAADAAGAAACAIAQAAQAA